jgi:hypothetical protein
MMSFEMRNPLKVRPFFTSHHFQIGEGTQRMETVAWHSRMMSDPNLGIKQGLAAKWFGLDWDPPNQIAPQHPGKLDALLSYARGEPQPREAFPEAVYVFDRSLFEKLGDLFTAGCFYAVKGKLADVLSRADLGRGGLIPLTIYQDDKATPIAGNFHIWEFCEQKSGFLPEESPKIRPAGIGATKEKDRWIVHPDVADDDIALAAAAAGPPDVWCDPRLMWSLFLSDALVVALREAKIKSDFSLCRCRLI